MSKNCPKCGAKRNHAEGVGWAIWACGTHRAGAQLFQSKECAQSQVAALQAENEALRDLLSKPILHITGAGPDTQECRACGKETPAIGHSSRLHWPEFGLMEHEPECIFAAAKEGQA